MYNWHLLDITHVLFLLVKLYPEMNVCERKCKYDNHLQPSMCSPDPMSFPAKYMWEVKGRRVGSRGCVVSTRQAQRTLEA